MYLSNSAIRNSKKLQERYNALLLLPQNKVSRKKAIDII